LLKRHKVLAISLKFTLIHISPPGALRRSAELRKLAIWEARLAAKTMVPKVNISADTQVSLTSEEPCSHP